MFRDTRKLTIRFVFVLIGLAIVLANSASGDETKKPNVVFIIVDDLGWIDVGFGGSKVYETLHVDKLAQSACRNEELKRKSFKY